MSLTRHDFRHWAQTAHHGDVIVYNDPGQERDELVFEYARRLEHAGLAFIYQRRVYDETGIPSGFEHVARRCSPRAREVLDRLGRTVATPFRLTGNVGRPAKLTPLEA